MVEFALIFPILVFLIFGIIEGALIMQGHLAVQHGAREAARFATTNQPIQGACMDRDHDSQIEDGFGEGDPDDLAEYPYCPRNHAADPSESDEHYYRRRVELIKLEAQKASVGLRAIKGGQQTDPGYFGIGVWGYPYVGKLRGKEFICDDKRMSETWDAEDNPYACKSFPGLKGLPVLVVIRHNVDIIDPLFSALVDYVPVEGQAQMINEGVQGEKGDLIPSFPTSPDPSWIEPITDTKPPIVDPTATPVFTTPKEYFLDLSPEISQNDLAEADRSHVFIATVTDEEEKTWSGIPVKFRTNEGGFSYSGTGPRDAKVTTDEAGEAAVTLYGKRPDTTAQLEAWLDYNGDGDWNAGEPGDRATKNWVATGPYITVEPGHKVIPEQKITIDVMDHPITDTYSLLWCYDSGGITDTSTIVQDPVTVDAGGDATGLEFTIPEDGKGLYYLETHASGSGVEDCGPNGRIAYTDVTIVNTPPDLKISIDPPATVCPETTFVLPAAIINASEGGTEDAFDVDFYLNPASSPPENPLGVTKQWVTGIGSNQTKAMTTVMWLDSPGEHVLWGRVDTSNHIEELEPDGESNNTYSVTLTTDPASASRPTDDTSLSGGDGDGFERNPGSAYVDGGGFAKSMNTGPGDPDRHEYSDFDFDIPETIDVQDMEVRLDWWLDGDGGDNRIGVQLFCDGGWTSVQWTSNEPTAENTVILDGWDRTCVRDDLNNGNFRVRLSLDSSEDDRDFFLDWVAVRVIGSSDFGCDEWPESSPWIDDSKPPGLEECYQLLDFGDFEGDPSPWPEYWYDHWNSEDTVLVYKNSLALRLFASYSLEPCTLFHPYLYQKLEVPDEIYATGTMTTTMHVRGEYAVDGSAEGSSCSAPGPEEDDVLSLQMRDGSGNPIPGTDVQLADGFEVLGWTSFEKDMTSRVNLPERAGQEMEVYLAATADGDDLNPYADAGTWFYLDNIECEVCTEWPIPEYVPGKASIGGRVLGDFAAQLGIDVWAYGQTLEGGGATYHTVTLQDGSYRFYNIEPGIYTIDAQIWLDPMTPRFGTRTVTANACNFNNEGECNFEVNLLLWW